MSSGDVIMEGIPLDRNIFLVLITLGAIVVARRQVSWGSLTTGNAAVTLFLLFSFLSITWSDFPFTAFKRWHKVFGHVIMALIVLTDRDPARAFTALLRRSAYVLLPVSVLFIKYYPDLGRGFDAWGFAVNVGVTTNKNALGNICFIMGVFFFAMMFVTPNTKRLTADLDRWIGLVFLGMIAWLLSRAESSTATVSTLLGMFAILGFRVALVKRHFSSLLVVTCVLIGLLVASTDIKEEFIVALGEDTTLTGRTGLWEDIETIPINPVFGAGFESFWLGERLNFFWSKYWWHPNQAHNGYYETYLNLGLVGLFLLCSMMLSGYRKARQQTMIDNHNLDLDRRCAIGLAEFRIAFLLGLVAHNVTDATFNALNPSFFLFFLAVLEYRGLQVTSVVASRDVTARTFVTARRSGLSGNYPSRRVRAARAAAVNPGFSRTR